MVKTRYYFNGKLVDYEHYKGALNLYAMSRNEIVKINGPSRVTCCSIQLMENDDDNVVEQFSASTSKIIINLNEPPPDDEQASAGEDDAKEVPSMLVLVPVPSIVNLIGACSPPFEKQLTKTDVQDGQGRLTMKKEFVNLHLVPMFNDNEDLVDGINVTVFNSEGRQYDMTFKLWASKLYVLMRGWKEFYKSNNLTKAGLYVTLWMFRHVGNNTLCFAITRGRRPIGL